MPHNDRNGRSEPMSMAEFNARAKRIAASTGAIEKGDTHRPRGTRFRRDANGGIPAAPKAEETAG